jgi:hypothetical protein
MEKYYINFYRDERGSKIKGNWKLTEEAVNEEKNSSLYKYKLGLVWTQTAAIERCEVEKIAKDNNMSIADVLSCI